MIHYGEKNFSCPVCGKSILSSDRLAKHLKTHSEVKERTIECSLCPKKFAHRTTLRNHMMYIHSTERPFVCELCGMTFKAQCNLTDHQQSAHSNERLFEC